MDRLDNAVLPYPWGSANDIPEFTGLPADGGPQAELWMGAHPSAPSTVRRGGQARSLRDVIAGDPDAELGPAVARRYGARLPFLFKLLAAAAPLSLQVHPDKLHAEAAHAAEVRDRAAERDYPDDNHKPELICALRDGFQALCGFRLVPDTIELLEEIAAPELAGYLTPLAGAVGKSGTGGTGGKAGEGAADALRALVTGILTEKADHASAVAAVRDGCRRLAAGGGRWAGACAAYVTVAEAYPGDPGVLVALLLNHAVLAEGDALFVAAGVPHCYLRGFGAELMASSDNVLRAGLTSKRVNVPEVLRVLDFRPGPLRVLRPERDGDEETYPVPVADFRLGRIRLGADGVTLSAGLPQIVLCVAGTALLRAADGAGLALRRGASAYLPASCAGVTATGPGVILRATVGS
jgi:mannose-6-phosphate isomerase